MQKEDWIKVDESLPEPDEDVLAYDDMYGVIIASYDTNYGWLSYEHGALDHVTHWSQLVLPE